MLLKNVNMPVIVGNLTNGNLRSMSRTNLMLSGVEHKTYFDSNLISTESLKSVLSKFLAHLSRRLIGELIVYPWSGVHHRHRRRPSSTMLRHLLLRNRLADRSQILCGASLGRGNDILFAASGSHDQDGRHAHIW